MNTVAHSQLPILGDTSRSHCVTDLPPSFECEITPGGLTTRAWTIGPDRRDVERVVLFPQGWNTTAGTLEPLARKVVEESDATAAVLFEQKRVPLPQTVREIPGYIRSTSMHRVEELRARTVESVGVAACEYYGLPTASIISHSLGSVDAIRATVDSDRLAISDITALAPAGRLEDNQIVPALMRAMQIAAIDCGADCEPSDTQIRFGAVRNVLQPAIFQTATEAAYGLSCRLDDYAARLAALMIPAVQIDFARDRLFGGHIRQVPGFIASSVISDGLACHCAPGHRTEAARIVKAMRLLWSEVNIRTA